MELYDRAIDDSFFILLNLNRYEVPLYRYSNFCQRYFLYIFDLEGIDLSKLEEIDYDNVKCEFFKQYEEQYCLEAMYYLYLLSFLN